MSSYATPSQFSSVPARCKTWNCNSYLEPSQTPRPTQPSSASTPDLKCSYLTSCISLPPTFLNPLIKYNSLTGDDAREDAVSRHLFNYSSDSRAESDREPDYLHMRIITISLKLPGSPWLLRHQAGPTLGLADKTVRPR